MTDPTPLHRLADKFREHAAIMRTTFNDQASANILSNVATDLEASLAAIDVEAAANSVIEEWTSGEMSTTRLPVLKMALTCALQSAFAAGQASVSETTVERRVNQPQPGENFTS